MSRIDLWISVSFGVIIMGHFLHSKASRALHGINWGITRIGPR